METQTSLTQSKYHHFSIAIIFGLIGFVLNFFPLKLYFPNFHGSFALGLIFPMIIAQAWGWRYGLLSVTLGLTTQYGWFLWTPSCGWATVLTVPLYTLWIVWHGWCAEKRKATNSIRWNPFLVEIPIRLVIAGLFFFVLPLIFSLNPPPRAPSAKTTVPIDHIHRMVITDFLNAYIVLFLANIGLNHSFLRKLMRIRWRPGQLSTTYAITAGFFAGLVFWVIDAIMDWWVFYPNTGTFLHHLFLKVPYHEIWTRTIFMFGCLTVGAGVGWYLRERRIYEETLKESESRYRQLVESMNEGLGIQNTEGKFDFVNDHFAKMLGYKPVEIVGREENTFLTAESLEKLKLLPKENDSRKWESYEIDWKGHNGQIIPTIVSPYPIMDADGAVQGRVAVVLDITKRKQAETALRLSEAFLDSIIEQSPFSMWIADINGTMVRQNAANRKLFGITNDDEVVGQYNLFQDNILNELGIFPTLKEVFTKGLTVNFVLDYDITKLTNINISNGTNRTLDVTISPIKGPDGSVSHAIIQHNDITERENLITELEKKNTELERFTYTVSHDLKSPLITIRDFLNMLEYDMQDNNEKQLRDDIRRIDEAAIKMSRLLDELLELSRVGRIINPPTVFAIDEVAREAAELVSGRIREASATVQITDNLPQVNADRNRIVEVFQNLIDNAVKFASAENEPTIEIGCTVNKDTATIYVRDNGKGIAKEYQEKVFGLFNRLDNAIDGTGIGLTMVKRVIEHHNGRIWVESDGLGKGSTFYFTLPVAEIK